MTCLENFLSITIEDNDCLAAYFKVVSVDVKFFNRVGILSSKIDFVNTVSLCLNDFKKLSVQPVVPIEESHTADKQNNRPSFKIYFLLMIFGS